MKNNFYEDARALVARGIELGLIRKPAPMADAYADHRRALARDAVRRNRAKQYQAGK